MRILPRYKIEEICKEDDTQFYARVRRKYWFTYPYLDSSGEMCEKGHTFHRSTYLGALERIRAFARREDRRKSDYSCTRCISQEELEL